MVIQCTGRVLYRNTGLDREDRVRRDQEGNQLFYLMPQTRRSQWNMGQSNHIRQIIELWTLSFTQHSPLLDILRMILQMPLWRVIPDPWVAPCAMVESELGCWNNHSFCSSDLCLLWFGNSLCQCQIQDSATNETHALLTTARLLAVRGYGTFRAHGLNPANSRSVALPGIWLSAVACQVSACQRLRQEYIESVALYLSSKL